MNDVDGSKVLVRREGLGAGRLLLAFAGGAVAGAVAGLLLAPASGAETRAKVRELARKTRNKVSRVPIAIREARVAARRAFNSGMHVHQVP